MPSIGQNVRHQSVYNFVFSHKDRFIIFFFFFKERILKFCKKSFQKNYKLLTYITLEDGNLKL